MRKKTILKNEVNSWLELKDKKDEFLRILEVLNRYYNLNPPDNYPSQSHIFRQNLLKSSPDQFKIFIKKFGHFEYFIAAELILKEETRFDSWVHIDGIEEERSQLKSKGISDHPVFGIVSLTDLFSNYCNKVELPDMNLDVYLKK